MAILLSDSYKVLTWDLNTKALDTSYWGKSTDSGRGCKVLLTQNGVAKIPSTETMRINFKKPSGLKVFIDGVISGNYFVFDFPNQVYAEVGEVQAELMLNVSSKFIMSSTFKIKVDASMTDGIASTSEFDALTDALADIDEVKADIIALENPVYTEASTLANLVSGELLTVAFGKIKKFFSFIGTTTLTTTAQTVTTAINELVTKTTLTDITSSITLNSNFTLLSKRATITGKTLTMRIIASPNIAMGANTLHNLGSISSAYKPSTIDCNTCGCLQDGSFLFQNGALVVIKADTGAINVSSNIALTSKYIQFTVTYDIA